MAGEVRSNLPEVLRGIRDVADCLNLRAVGRYGLLGEDLMDLTAEGIFDRTVLGQQEPGGGPLAPLAESTLARKRKAGYPDTIGVATGHMLALDQLKGDRSVSADRATMAYGRDEEARLRMAYFSEGHGGRRRQPPRPVFEFDDRIDAELDALVDEVVIRAVERNGG